MSSELELRRKYNFTAHDKHIILVKKAVESDEHVLCKALGFALYLPVYPELHVEMKVEGRYKPDLVQLDDAGKPVFWAECGSVKKEKIRKLLKKFKHTHFAFLKWRTDLSQFADMVKKEMRGIKRSGEVDIIGIPEDAVKFVGKGGKIRITFRDCEVIKL